MNGEQGQCFLLEIFLFTARLFFPLAGCFVAVTGSKYTALIGIWHLNYPVSTKVMYKIKIILYVPQIVVLLCVKWSFNIKNKDILHQFKEI